MGNTLGGWVSHCAGGVGYGRVGDTPRKKMKSCSHRQYLQGIGEEGKYWGNPRTNIKY